MVSGEAGSPEAALRVRAALSSLGQASGCFLGKSMALELHV